ncbi:MAG: hypothetical protein RL381_631, partial [Actinomycetota bacterium]
IGLVILIVQIARGKKPHLSGMGN